jgi:hypothetical protein
MVRFRVNSCEIRGGRSVTAAGLSPSSFGPPVRANRHSTVAPLSLRTSRDSAVGIATSYGLDDREVRVRVPVGSRISSSPNRPDWL